jgi:hypothetical protein
MSEPGGSAAPKAGKDRHIEVYAPKLILDLMGIAPLSPADRQTFLGWWRQDVRPTFNRWEQSSCNWDSMLDAVWLLHSPNEKIGGKTAVQLWSGWFQWQLGLAPPPLDEPDAVRYFGGRETLSNTYEPFRWGSVAAVQWWALERHRPELAKLANQYSLIGCALLAPGASPGPAVNLQSGSRGLFYNGPYMPQPGQRTTPAHAGQDCRGVLFSLACDYDLTISKREDWPGRVARAVGDAFRIDAATAARIRGFVDSEQPDPSFLTGLLQGIRVWAAVHHLRWPGTRAAYTPLRLNTLTPCIFGDVYDDTARTATILFPWPEGSRGINRTDDTGFCGIVEERRRTFLQARNQREITDPDKLIQQQAVLPNGLPLYEFVESRQGCAPA